MPQIEFTNHAIYGMERRGISSADVEYALNHAVSEYSAKNNDIVRVATLPDGSNIKVRSRTKAGQPTLIVDVYIIR
jgi:hypothetical protein